MVLDESLTRNKRKQATKGGYDQFSALAGVYSLFRDQVMGDTSQLALLTFDREHDSGLTSKPENSEQNTVSMILRSAEDEKRRIARDLHDGLGQLLTSINLHVQQCLKTAHESGEVPENLANSMDNISAMTKQAMSELRGICGSLRPAILDDLGVLAAIKWQCRLVSQGNEQLDVSTDLDVREAQIPESSKTAIYRIVQESLNNALKYSEAKNLDVCIHHLGDYLKLEIKDNGVGFDTSDKGSGMGMISMRERAESIGGVFSVQSSPGQGVKISVLFPQQQIAISG